MIGTPVKLSQLTKAKKDSFLILSILEADLLLDYGYADPLNQLASSMPSGVLYQLCAIKIGT